MHPFNIAKDIEEKILRRYAHRLMKLKVKFAEISITSRPNPGSQPGVYRICISNEVGFLLKIHIYKVEEARDTGILKFFSYHDNKSGFFEHVGCPLNDHAQCNLVRYFIYNLFFILISFIAKSFIIFLTWKSIFKQKDFFFRVQCIVYPFPLRTLPKLIQKPKGQRPWPWKPLTLMIFLTYSRVT